MTGFADRVAKICYDFYENGLPKTGKPIKSREWTVLAAILQTDNNDKVIVVSMGTGSKCLGQSKLSAEGDILNDSHAEIIARRAFLRYIYHQIEECNEKRESVFEPDASSGKFRLKEGISFTFFCSHTPCGDASIIPKESNGTCEVTNNDEPLLKRARLDSEDVHRTGAKCVDGGPQDPQLPGSGYHITGALRTKPGRGDRTLSMSCSDKIAKWTYLGVQGALLSILLNEPIFFSQIVIGKCHFNMESMTRALVGRFAVTALNIKQRCPEILQSAFGFEDGKNSIEESGNESQPSPASIIWCLDKTRQLEIAVEGRKQGVTKKTKNKAAARLCVTKKSLFQRFVHLMQSIDKEKLPVSVNEDLSRCSYRKAKQSSTEYQNKWKAIKDSVFKGWTVKNSELLNFTFDDV